MDTVEFAPEQLTDLARWLKVICEPKRLLLFEKICEGVHCNCELGEALQMAPNLISHHLSVLRDAGLVDVERDPNDARWIYYSVNVNAMEEMKQIFNAFFDQERIQPRRLTCGPQLSESTSPNLLKLDK